MSRTVCVTDSEPPIRQPRARVEVRSPERVKLSEELAVLNRPLDDEVEYYDEAPRWRAPALVAVVVLAALGGAGYLLRARLLGAVVPPQAAATEPAPARPQVAPIAVSPAARAEPESDPPVSPAAAAAPDGI